jgi:DNA primase
MSTERQLFIKDLAGTANIIEVARDLGMQVAQPRSGSPKALCPFHPDRTPSLVLYHKTTSQADHYHCYACGAHGNVYELIKKLRGVDFRDALAAC